MVKENETLPVELRSSHQHLSGPCHTAPLLFSTAIYQTTGGTERGDFGYLVMLSRKQ